METQSNVQLAYDEIQAITEKYKVTGLCVVSDPKGNHIRSGHFSVNKEMIFASSPKDASNLINDLACIVNRSYMLLTQNIFKLDITMQSISEGNTQLYNIIYTEAEKIMSDGQEKYLSDLEGALRDTLIAFKTKTGRDVPDTAPKNIKPKTMNKIRQICNVLAGTYYTPSN